MSRFIPRIRWVRGRSEGWSKPNTTTTFPRMHGSMAGERLELPNAAPGSVQSSVTTGEPLELEEPEPGPALHHHNTIATGRATRNYPRADSCRIAGHPRVLGGWIVRLALVRLGVEHGARCAPHPALRSSYRARRGCHWVLFWREGGGRVREGGYEDERPG